MSQIYSPFGQDGFELCHPSDQTDFFSVSSFLNGTARGDSWAPIGMELIHEDEGKRLRRSSAPWSGAHALIFRPEVFAKIGKYLKGNCELLPLDCPGHELYICNPWVVDALDEPKSAAKRFKSGKVKMFESYAFKKEVVANLHIFKIPNLHVSPTFLSCEFVERWCENGLTGLDFELLWDSDGPLITRTIGDRLTGAERTVRKGPQ